jgi:hypothetical protein
MNLEIVEVESAGDLERERVVLRATSDVDVGRFAILSSRRTSDGHIAGGNIQSAYWIPDKKIKTGDLVIIYTKVGSSSVKTSEGSTSYFFYWGLNFPRWTEGFIPILTELSTWKTYRAKTS